METVLLYLKGFVFYTGIIGMLLAFMSATIIQFTIIFFPCIVLSLIAYSICTKEEFELITFKRFFI